MLPPILNAAYKAPRTFPPVPHCHYWRDNILQNPHSRLRASTAHSVPVSNPRLSPASQGCRGRPLYPVKSPIVAPGASMTGPGQRLGERGPRSAEGRAGDAHPPSCVSESARSWTDCTRTSQDVHDAPVDLSKTLESIPVPSHYTLTAFQI